jgi:hypothetical protein
MVFLYLSATMLFNYDKDTTDVSGAAFVAVAILAALAFTYAGVLPQSDPDRNEVVYAGERLSQGAMIFLLASLLKYGTFVLPVQLAALPASADTGPMFPIELVRFLQVFLFLVFTFGLVFSQLGYAILGQVLTRQVSRRSDQRLFPPPPK